MRNNTKWFYGVLHAALVSAITYLARCVSDVVGLTVSLFSPDDTPERFALELAASRSGDTSENVPALVSQASVFSPGGFVTMLRTIGALRSARTH